MSKNIKNLIASLDIGSYKTRLVIAQRVEQGFEVIGVGETATLGVKKGTIVNIEEVINSIEAAKAQAETAAGVKISSVHTTITGGHISSYNSHGIVGISGSEVAEYDIVRVVDAAKAIIIPNDQKILHIIPQEYIIDGRGGIQSPISMSGVRLEARIHIITASINMVQNITKCIRQAGLDLSNIMLSSYADSHAVLDADQKELGVALINIGAGTTDISVFKNGALTYSSVVPVAGNHISQDLAVAFQIPTSSADNLKMQYSDLSTSSEATIVTENNETIEQDKFNNVISSRIDEIFALVQQELANNDLLDGLDAGIVISGGTAKIKGMIDYANNYYNLPVRLGTFENLSEDFAFMQSSEYVTALGSLCSQCKAGDFESRTDSRFNLSRAISSIRNWFVQNF